MPDGSWTWEETASARKGGDGIGLEIFAKLASVLECEPAEPAEDRAEGHQSQ
jgi:hypothetical protein